MESIYLSGADDVRTAGRTISNAADTMRNAASTIDEALTRHRQAMDEWIMRFEAVIEKMNASAGPG